MNWTVTVKDNLGNPFASQTFTCPGNAAEYALAFDQMGYYTNTEEKEIE